MDFFLTKEQVDGRLEDNRNVLTVDSCKGEGYEDEGERESDGSGEHRGDPSPKSSPISPPDKEDVFSKLKMSKIIDSTTPGRKRNIRNRSTEENGSVGLSTKVLGSKATEKLFGVDPQQQNHIVHGHTSSVDRVNKKNQKEDLLEEIYRQSGVVTNLAFSRLLKSLDLLDEEKIGEIEDPMKLLSTARGLSGIVKDMTPKEGEGREQSVHFHVYRPEQNQDSDYETIEVNKSDYESVEV